MNFTWKLEKLNRLIGWILWMLGFTPSCTTSIADTIELGYGPEFDGFFKYQAPEEAYKMFLESRKRFKL